MSLFPSPLRTNLISVPRAHTSLDIIHRKMQHLFCLMISLGNKYIIQYDDQLSRPYNMTYTDLTSNSVKLLFSFNEINLDPRRQIQKLEVRLLKSIFYLYVFYFLGSL